MAHGAKIAAGILVQPAIAATLVVVLLSCYRRGTSAALEPDNDEGIEQTKANVRHNKQIHRSDIHRALPHKGDLCVDVCGAGGLYPSDERGRAVLY